MRTIKIKSLSLVNFKGVRSLDLNFTDSTVICGDNGTGKTTVFDAFTWLLFGKDSTDRSDSNFNIKTLDAAGKPILHLEHSVSAVLSVDGSDIKLQRKYVENWVKPRGTTEETLQNHKTEYLVNDVKLGTKKEYDGRISEIVNEDVFKMITNPFYFTSLPAAKQKDMLLDMAGSVSDDEVAQIKPEYIDLLAQLNGRPLEEFKKEVAAKKRACKDALAVIPAQISTAAKLKPEPEDWAELENQINDKRVRISDIDARITDKTKLVEAESSRKVAVQRQIGDKMLEIQKRENALVAQANSGRADILGKVSDCTHVLAARQMDLQWEQRNASSLKKDIDTLQATLESLRAEFRSISAEELKYPDGAFVCPTCKRPLDVEDIEAKQRVMRENFNNDKVARLKANKQKGTAARQTLECKQQEMEKIQGRISQLESGVIEAQNELERLNSEIPEEQNIDLLKQNDETLIQLKNQLTELNNQLTMDAKPVDVSELRAEKQRVSDEIFGLQSRLARRDQIQRADQEIQELEEKRIANNQALADAEKLEYVALSFQKDKDAELSKRINGLFRLVQFSFVDEQLNGGEKLTCVCTVNGTPYPDVNNAGKINAGLDIINAICSAKGITAPIFVDNAESVNEIMPTESQKVLLYVSTDKELTIK